jgi:hypothetical protein
MQKKLMMNIEKMMRKRKLHYQRINVRVQERQKSKKVIFVSDRMESGNESFGDDEGRGKYSL